jgi:hypothetical protein
VVHGGFYVVDPEAGPPDREVHARAVELLRALLPEAFADDEIMNVARLRPGSSGAGAAVGTGGCDAARPASGRNRLE